MKAKSWIPSFLLLAGISPISAATWTGLGADANWSTAGNWDAAPANGDPLTFSGTTQQTNVNNSLTSVGDVLINSRGWDISGSGTVTLNGNMTFDAVTGGTGGTGNVAWGQNTELATGNHVIRVDNFLLDMTGIISGAGGFSRNIGGTSDGTLRLGTANTFTGKVDLNGGLTEVTLLADEGVASSLGKATGADSVINFGTTGSGSAGILRYTGSGSTSTDRAIKLTFRNHNSAQIIQNYSSGNGDLTFSNTAAVAMLTSNSSVDGSGNTTGFLRFDGTSTGLTTFAGLLQDNPLDSKDRLAIDKRGAGTLVLSNANTYTAGTVIATGGTVRATHSSALGSGAVTVAANGALALSGGINVANALSLAGSGISTTGALISQAGANTYSGNITLAGATVIGNTDSAGVSLDIAGGVDLNSNNLTLNGNHRTLTVSGKITGSAAAVSVGTSLANVIFSNDTSDFAAPISTGFVRNLQFTSIGNVGGGSSALGAPTNTTEGTITFNNSNSFTRFEYIGSTDASTDRILAMNDTGGPLTLVNSSGAKLTYTANLSRAASSSGSLDFVSNVGSTIEFSGDITDGASASALNVSVNSSGTTILSGTNSYTGTTNVTASATLRVNGTHTGGDLTTVAGTLGGSGSLGAVNVTGVLAPGNSIESLITADLSLLAGSTLQYEMENTTSTGADLLGISGNLSLTDTVTLDLMKIGTNVWATDDKLTLISYTGDWNDGLFTFDGNTVADDSIITFDGAQWLFDYNDTLKGNNYSSDASGSYVTMTVIPEPSAAALLGGFATLLLLRRRRH